MPPSLVKPPRWAWHPALLTPEGRNLARGLVFLLPLQETIGSPTEIVQRRRGSVTDGPLSWRLTDRGPSIDATGGGGGLSASGAFTYFDGSDPAYQLDKSWTVAVWASSDIAKADMYVNGAALISKGTGGETAGLNHNFYLGYDKSLFTDDQTGDGWLVLYEKAGTAGANVTAKWIADPVVGERFMLLAVLDDDKQELRLYHNGVLRRTVSITDTAEVNDQNIAIGVPDDISGDWFADGWDGPIEQTIAWDRALTDTEILRLSADPFILLRRNWAIPTVLTTSGTAHTIDVTETVGVADTVEAVKAISVEVVEPVGATDVIEVVKAITVEIVDTVGVTDVVERAMVYSRDVVETVGVTDTFAAAKAILLDIVDTVGATDTVTVAKQISVEVVEPVGVTDTFTRAMAYARVIIEPVGVTDVVERAVAYSREIVEPVGVTDTVSTSTSGGNFWTPDPAGYTDAASTFTRLTPDGPTWS